jgi:Tfp pilus assembly protein PilV
VKWERGIAIKSRQMTRWFLFRGSAKYNILAYSTLWHPNGWGLHSTPFKWSKDQLEYHDSLFISIISRCEESPQFGVSHALHTWSRMNTRVRGSRNTHKNLSCSNNKHTSQEKSTKTTQRSLSSKKRSNLYLNETMAWLWSLDVVGCSMCAWL